MTTNDQRVVTVTTEEASVTKDKLTNVFLDPDVASVEYNSADQLYLSDGLQFILQSPSQSGNFEFGLARTETGEGLVKVWIAPAGFKADEVAAAVRLDTARTGDITVYDAKIPLKAIGFDEATVVNGFKFNAIIYDYDGIGETRESWIEIAPGIASGKDYSKAPYVKILNTNQSTKSERKGSTR